MRRSRRGWQCTHAQRAKTRRPITLKRTNNLNSRLPHHPLSQEAEHPTFTPTTYTFKDPLIPLSLIVRDTKWGIVRRGSSSLILHRGEQPRRPPKMVASKDTLFRSAEMSLTQLYISNEIGREVISALGELGEVQFRDVSSSLHATKG